MIEVQPPNNIQQELNDFFEEFAPLSSNLPQVVFLAGSIENGTAERWQDKVLAFLAHNDALIFNPRRDDWDSSWVAEASNPKFAEQVNWELDALEAADLVLFYFDPNTKSSITLLELGLMASENKQIVVCCPQGFWRKGNVDIVCKRHDIKQVDSLDALMKMANRALYKGAIWTTKDDPYFDY